MAERRMIMKASWTLYGTGVLMAVLGLAVGASIAASPPTDPVTPAGPGVLNFKPIGNVAIVQPAGTPTSVAIFLSGDGGWNSGVVDMANGLAKTGALVLGVNTPAYIKRTDAIPNERCHSVAVDLQMLAQFVQKRQAFKEYMQPVLVGYSSGATLAYIAAAQSPASFKGAISLGFGPELYNKKPYCKSIGLKSHPNGKDSGYIVEPSATLGAPWVVLQGLQDQVASADQTRAFVAQTHGATLVELPKVGHGYSVYRNWWPQFEQAYRAMASALPPEHPGDSSEQPCCQFQRERSAPGQRG
ncbi:MAG: AcvB/VirJ family lysyl-phosphatidylglycerol hydrolase [Gammaproteobacteria bacterium]